MKELNRLITLSLLICFVSLTLLNVSCAQAVTYDLAIEDVTIFDSKQKKTIPKQTILINADTIAAIIKSGQNFSAKKTIAGKGRLVTPGFVDTHIHINQMFFPENKTDENPINNKSLGAIKQLLAEHYLRYGTTTVIDMGIENDWLEDIIELQRNPSSEFSTVFFCGSSMITDTGRRPASHHFPLQNPQHAKTKVQEYAKLGLKYMKLYSRLEYPELKVIAEEAPKHNITLNGHIDRGGVTIHDAMQLGVKNFEHGFSIISDVINVFDHWDTLNKTYNLNEVRSIDEWTAAMLYFFKYVKSNPELDAKMKAVVDKMIEQEATLSTTIHVLAASAGKTSFFSSFDDEIRDGPSLTENYTEEGLQDAFKVMMDYLKYAHDKGLKLRIGTDCRDGGRAMLSEMTLLSEYGFSTEDILKIATLNGAEAMKLDKKLGSIEIGKQADLIIFGQNPFEDSANFLSKKQVIKGGNLVSQ